MTRYNLGVTQGVITACSGNKAGTGDVMLYTYGKDNRLTPLNEVVKVVNSGSEVPAGWLVDVITEPNGVKHITPRCKCDLAPVAE